VLSDSDSALMWASFVVGMELPGKRAIFWRLALDFQPDDGRPWGPLSYNLTIKGFDERLDLLHTTGELFSGDRLCAVAQIRAFVRPDSPQPSIAGITALMPRSEQLKGKVALVIGGSRGLGAAISQALALQGCSVLVNYHHSKVQAEQVRASLGDEAALINWRRVTLLIFSGAGNYGNIFSRSTRDLISLCVTRPRRSVPCLLCRRSWSSFRISS
jgi:hypothetical protein